jgi:hypothetical protein
MKYCKCGNFLFFQTPSLNCLKCGLPVPYYKITQSSEKQEINMDVLYAVKVFVISKPEEERAATMSNWQVEPGHALLDSLLEESKKAKGESKRIIVAVDNPCALGVAEKALTYLEKKLKESRDNMLIQEINYLGEGVL